MQKFTSKESLCVEIILKVGSRDPFGYLIEASCSKVREFEGRLIEYYSSDLKQINLTLQNVLL